MRTLSVSSTANTQSVVVCRMSNTASVVVVAVVIVCYCSTAAAVDAQQNDGMFCLIVFFIISHLYIFVAHAAQQNDD